MFFRSNFLTLNVKAHASWFKGITWTEEKYIRVPCFCFPALRRHLTRFLVVVSVHTRGNDQAVTKIVNWSACEQARARCEVHIWYHGIRTGKTQDCQFQNTLNNFLQKTLKTGSVTCSAVLRISFYCWHGLYNVSDTRLNNALKIGI